MKKYRITVLTPGLIRLEYSEEGSFEDRPSQTVVNRDFPPVSYQEHETEDSLEILTDRVHLIYNKQEFSSHGLSIEVRGRLSAYHSIWHYGEEPKDLGGTARTLDEADGAVALEHGILSRYGFSVLNDSGTLLMTEDGWVAPRNPGSQDLYFFGYGHDYMECLRDFYRLTGKTPLLPRYALGNWWSRYYVYTEESYKELMNRFEQEEIPFSVAVIDMDWHVRDVDPKYGSGWTAYTWNRELFPDPKRFMDWLHEHHMRITLNVHPAGGVQAFEEAYLPMAKALGRDYENEEPINFDIADRAFLDAYFKYLHHPNEELGVDFWWVDWQQGGLSSIPGLDPLWMLNHYHYLDSARRGRRRLTFSRYAGPGSHRYPIGFSGDSIISWESLDFQPYFTANASNIGYGWWSHDIGGHMNGYKDEELTTRWVQFGVFSPIMRLHSSKNVFTYKEPWNFNKTCEAIMKRYLKLRHELIPYLYTMNYLASEEGLPLIRPMYYENPEAPEAYEAKNEYYFGTQLIACPITKPVDPASRAAAFTAYLPEGKWFDFFTGCMYDGGRKLTLYRDLEDIPVLARAGAIIPMTDLSEFTNSVDNPVHMAVRVFAGADGSFELYEDEGDTSESRPEDWAITSLFWDNEKKTLTIRAPRGKREVLPARRSWRIALCGIEETHAATVCVNGREETVTVSCDAKSHSYVAELPMTDTESEIHVSFAGAEELASNEIVEQIFQVLDRAYIDYSLKNKIYRYAVGGMPKKQLLGILTCMELPESVFGALCEILLA